MLTEKKRITILDGFRCIAIIMVLLSHYTATWTPPESTENYYPYEDSYTEVFLFKYGYLGVELFFMISGFVIFMTLEKCSSIKEFLVKRFIRLFPLLLLASIITFIFPKIFDTNNEFPVFHRPFVNFLPSLTFSDIWIWNTLLNKKIGYIDGSYWSLVIEVKFYIFSALIYFFNKKKFIRNWLYFTLIILVAYIFIQKESIQKLINILFIAKYIVFFTLGVLFYDLFKTKNVKNIHIALVVIFLALQFSFLQTRIETGFILSFIALFFLFIYKESWLSFLNFRLLNIIGLCSYPLYLIHQSIGVMMIGKLAKIFNLHDSSWVLIPIVILIMITISYFIHIYLERRLSKNLSTLIFRKKD